ncbi:glycine cleavage system H protein-like isoform X2 [Convolutriloba macropyga]|uniref:glycine cleavage system H protein-like isoform X2 n=1 Tax=Convolutriloba macropyga TaxID=536237 RepID=UPI003F526A80
MSSRIILHIFFLLICSEVSCVDRYYTVEYMWVKLRAKNESFVTGITDYGQSLMGEVFQISLPTEGQTVDQGEPLIAVEAQFKSKVFHAPLGGQVLEVNQDVIDDPTLINSSPDLFGWLLKMEPSDLEEELPNILSQSERDNKIRSRFNIIN